MFHISEIGNVYGHLTVLEYAGTKYRSATNKKTATSLWLCRCTCGRTHCPGKVVVLGPSLRSGRTRSCGHRGNPDVAFNAIYLNYKGKARRRNLPFQLTKEEFRILTQANCYYCGAPPASRCKTSFCSYTYNGIDRKNSALGYTIENCVPCCGTHNKMKSDMSVEKFLAEIEKVHRHLLSMPNECFEERKAA